MDRILIQLREAGVLDRTTGILIGKIRGENEGRIEDHTTDIKNILLQITEEYDIPIIAGMDFGHYTPNLPMPYGVKAKMDAEQLDVRLLEPYVK
jgi:muramoyltetrapeptide carboxypeptidase